MLAALFGSSFVACSSGSGTGAGAGGANACSGVTGGAPGSGGNAAGGAGGNATGGAGGSATDGASGQGGSTLPASMCYSFDQNNGVMNVDWASFLSQYDLVYTKPVTVTSTTNGSDSRGNGVPFGNGRIGAMIWNPDNNITMQLTHVDAAPTTQLSEGLVLLKTTPALGDSSSAFKQRLNLYDGTVTITYGTDRTITVFGNPDSDLIGIHVHDARTCVSIATLDLNFWGAWTDLNWGVNLKNTSTWRSITQSTTSDTVSFSRGQADPDKYGYTLAATVDGTTATASKPDGSTVRLTIQPTTDYTIWIAVATRKWASNNDSNAAATSLLSDAKTKGYDAILKANQDYWHQTWPKSMVQYSAGAEQDYLMSLYYISTYMFGGGARGKGVYQFISGIYRFAGDSDLHWQKAYWVWNQRPYYNSFFASNRPEWVDPWLNMYANNQATNTQQTQSAFGVAGLRTPETMDQDGTPFLSDYTNNIFTSGLEVAFNMYDKYRYTNNTDYVKNTAYEYMKAVVDFYMAYAKKSGSTYSIQNSNAHETYWKVTNPSTDLTALRVAIPRLIEMQEITGTDTDMPAKWQDFLTNLAPVPTSGGKIAACEGSCGSSHNSENPELESVWPYGYYGLGSSASDLSMAKTTWNGRANKDNMIWSPCGPQAARLGLGDGAYTSLKATVSRNQVYASGICDDTNGRYEANGMVLSNINESLMQSYDGTIRAFPAVPSAATTARFMLLATGGFLVSSEKLSGKIPYVGIKSLYGKHAVVANPWGTAAVQVRSVSDGKTVATGSTATIEFDTTAGATYVVEQTSDPCTGHEGSAIAGTRNDAPRTLGSRHLGM